MTQLNKKDLIAFLTEGFPLAFKNEQQREALFDLLIKMVNDDQENYWAAPRQSKEAQAHRANSPLHILVDAGNSPIVLVSITHTGVEILLPEKQETKDWKQHVAKIALLLLTTLNMWSQLQKVVNESASNDEPKQKFQLSSITDFHSSQPTGKSNPARKLSTKHTRKKSLLNKRLALLIKEV